MDNIRYYDDLADVYGCFFRDFERSMIDEGEQLAAFLRRHGVDSVLDACCGTGRQLIPLLVHGFQAVGADASAPMIRETANRARARGFCPTLVQTAFHELPARVNRQFDAVIALGNGLCNLACAGDIFSALQAFRACCRAHGTCLIGIKDFEALADGGPSIHTERVVDSGSARTVLVEIWDVRRPLLISTTYVIQTENGVAEGWKSRVARTHEYMLEQDELTSMALRAGFSAVERLPEGSEALFALKG
jgi:SAM-dependent methyltransferase